jgi:hypothetical protein
LNGDGHASNPADHGPRRRQLKGERVQPGDRGTPLQVGNRFLHAVLPAEQVEVPTEPGAGQPDEQADATFENPRRDVLVKHASEEALQEKLPLQFVEQPVRQPGLSVQRPCERLAKGGRTRIPPGWFATHGALVSADG